MSVSRLNASRVSESQALAETLVLVVVATTVTALPRHPLQEEADVRVVVDTMLRSAICHLATVLIMVMMRVCVLDRAYTVGETPRSTASEITVDEIGVGETAVHHAVGGTTTVRATILLVVVRNLTR